MVRKDGVQTRESPIKVGTVGVEELPGVSYQGRNRHVDWRCGNPFEAVPYRNVAEFYDRRGEHYGAYERGALVGDGGNGSARYGYERHGGSRNGTDGGERYGYERIRFVVPHYSGDRVVVKPSSYCERRVGSLFRISDGFRIVRNGTALYQYGLRAGSFDFLDVTEVVDVFAYFVKKFGKVVQLD